MRAVTIVEGRIEIHEHVDPVAGVGEILVRVRAAGLNGADLAQLAGRYPVPAGVAADIPGLEFAGEVVALGPGATRFAVGDSVMAVVAGSGQAELAVVHERQAMPVPTGLGWAEAGSLPEAFTTAHDAVFTQAELALGERLCVHGAAGGVGTAAVQLGIAAGADVVATVRSPEQRSAVAALGATVVDPAETQANGPYDVVLELIGAPNIPTDLASLATGGRIAVIGIAGGTTFEMDLRLLSRKRARMLGSVLRSRPLEQKAAAARLLERHVLPLVASRRITVPVHAQFELGDASRAYEQFASGGKFGKLVIVMNPR